MSGDARGYLASRASRFWGKEILGSCHDPWKRPASGVPENQDSARRWSGFVCPDCRFLFRIARDHDGKGLVCPSCSRLLRIPEPGDALPPLLVDQFDANDERLLQLTGSSTNGRAKNVRRKRTRRKRRTEDPDWEARTASRPRRRSHARRQWLWLAAGIASLAGALGLIIATSHNAGRTATADPAGGGLPDPVAEPANVSEPAVADVPPEDAGSVDHAGFLSDAASVVRGFLNATTVDDLLKFVDRPERVAGRVARYHPDGVVEPPGLADYSQFSRVTQIGRTRMVPLRTRDMQIRTIALRETADGIKVDWEHWTGWSAMPPEQFMSKSTDGTHAFRVELQKVDYYNFGFSDETRWQSVRLVFPDRETSAYGYVDRQSQLLGQVMRLLDSDESRAIVEIRQVDGGVEHKQVEVTRILSESWIDPEFLEEP